ncbi:uncharacterized protein LOC122715353 isoform X2 [Apis laboriosa]|uniref:uncharacterized protein LOC122715353 isoform X2 n=1 Tax=Apis laboriosa TaxID=183418 RepID=UPI001CC373D2|nr:uncharacterized protein LOC122715353 isoform X2 [Apis laboriosa]
MVLKQCLLSTIVITIFFGVTPVFTWNPDIHRYESYDLEKGPVFYEAYYPDTNEEPHSSYQEKRYFDRGAVLEKSYQIPSERLTYPENNIQLDNYQNSATNAILQNDDRFSLESNTRSLDIQEISKIARRAISRDLENWNTLENFLDRVKDQDSFFHRRIIVPEPGYRIEQQIRRIDPLSNSLKQQRGLRRDLYEEIQEEPLALPSRIQLDERDSIRRLTTRDLANRDTLKPISSIQYNDNKASREQEVIQAIRTSQLNTPLLKDANPSDSKSIIDSYPKENIFAPRPQVINYIFSRKPELITQNKAQNLSQTKNISEFIPRNYGDNLIQNEVKKTAENKDVKVTSIEISEVPKHKTRHHHGEWPKRDYSRHHQS